MDAERFACVLEQYPASLPNRRLMYIDRLLREMPHKTRTEIVSGEPHSSYLHNSHYLFSSVNYLCISYVSGCPSFTPELMFRAGERSGSEARDVLTTSKYTGGGCYGVVVCMGDSQERRHQCYNQLCLADTTLGLVPRPWEVSRNGANTTL